MFSLSARLPRALSCRGPSTFPHSGIPTQIQSQIQTQIPKRSVGSAPRLQAYISDIRQTNSHNHLLDGGPGILPHNQGFGSTNNNATRTIPIREARAPPPAAAATLAPAPVVPSTDLAGSTASTESVIPPVVSSQAQLQNRDEFWRKVPIWRDVAAENFLSYSWSVSSLVFLTPFTPRSAFCTIKRETRSRY